MKINFIIFFLLCVSSLQLLAQAPKAFKYQAVVRNTAGNVISNQNVNLRIDLTQNGSLVYKEMHAATTNSFGLVNLEIGRGQTMAGTFANIDWSKATSIEIFLDPTGGTNHQSMGRSELLSVPYALYAATGGGGQDADADPNNEIQTISKNGSDITLSRNGGTVSVNDADADVTNEIQTISKNGSDITLSRNGGTVSVNDADADVTNEIQTISLNGTTLSLSKNGGSVNLPSGGQNPWQDGGNGIIRYGNLAEGTVNVYNKGTVEFWGKDAQGKVFIGPSTLNPNDAFTAGAVATLGLNGKINTYLGAQEPFGGRSLKNNNVGQLKIFNGLSKAGTEIYTAQDNRSFLVMKGPADSIYIELGAGFINPNSTNAGFISTFGRNDKRNTYIGPRQIIPNGTLTTTNEQAGELSVAGPTGKFVARMSSTDLGNGFFQLFNNVDSNAIEIAVGGSGGGLLSTRKNNTVTSFIGSRGVSEPFSGYIYANTKGANGSVAELYGAEGKGGQIWLADQKRLGKVFIGSAVTTPGGDGMGEIFIAGQNGNGNVYLGHDAGSGRPNNGQIQVLNPQGQNKAGLFIDANGKGVIYAEIKNFRMDDPVDNSKEIWYSSLEGPEAAAYERGTIELKNGRAVVVFSDHFQKVINAGQFTVILTPLSGDSKGLAAINKTKTGFEVVELFQGAGNYSFDWEVKAIRKGFENFKVSRFKNSNDVPSSVAIPNESFHHNNSEENKLLD
ncbi:MAG TPA: hypothetical protein PK006_06070 [Saprospiraceae bacterium]|nr:hypothetical protein [Saprospiraceae bacterium]